MSKWPKRIHMVWMAYERQMTRCSCGHPESHVSGSRIYARVEPRKPARKRKKAKR